MRLDGPGSKIRSLVGRVPRWITSRRAAVDDVEPESAPTATPSPPPGSTVVLLTTWNRPALLRQSLPQIEREAASIGAPLVIADDQSDDAETLALLTGAAERGATVIRRDYVRQRNPDLDLYVHRLPEAALDHIVREHGRLDWLPPSFDATAPIGTLVSELHDLWAGATNDAHVYTQLNNLFAVRYILSTYPDAEWIVKVDDDVAVRQGTFAHLHETYRRATQANLDVLCVSGIHTVNEPVVRQFDGYGITRGACAVTMLSRTADWVRLLAEIPEWQIIRDGFDLSFVWTYAVAHRPGSVTIAVTPSLVYHTGFNGVHVRDSDLNCDYAGPLDDVTVQ